MAIELVPLTGVRVGDLTDAAQLASLADETPEGRSVVVPAKKQFTCEHATWPTSGRASCLSPCQALGDSGPGRDAPRMQALLIRLERLDVADFLQKVLVLGQVVGQLDFGHGAIELRGVLVGQAEIPVGLGDDARGQVGVGAGHVDCDLEPRSMASRHSPCLA